MPKGTFYFILIRRDGVKQVPGMRMDIQGPMTSQMMIWQFV